MGSKAEEPCNFIFEFPFLAKHDSVAASEENDATEEARGTPSGDLFRARLDETSTSKHEPAQLAGKIDWTSIDGEITPLYSYKGQPGIPTRFAIGCRCSTTFMGLSLIHI